MAEVDVLEQYLNSSNKKAKKERAKEKRPKDPLRSDGWGNLDAGSLSSGQLDSMRQIEMMNKISHRVDMVAEGLVGRASLQET